VSETLITLPADDGAALLLRAPFPPGDGPFKVKGNAYRGHLKFVEDEVPGGLAAQREALLAIDPERGEQWADCFEQPFLPSAWYDVYPLGVAGIACARVLGEDYLDFVYRRSCQQARLDIGGIYKFLLKFVSAKAIATRVPSLVSRYFDFASAVSSAPDQVHVEGISTGIPVALAPWWWTVVHAYITTVVEIAGKQSPTVELGDVFDRGESHDQPICTLHVHIVLVHESTDIKPAA
jgi:hypothetical protein